MYQVDLQNKKLIEIPITAFATLNLKERFDIQEWISGTPKILGEELLIIAKELILLSGKRLDLLAIDKQGSLVVIELKRDDSGCDVEWQGTHPIFLLFLVGRLIGLFCIKEILKYEKETLAGICVKLFMRKQRNKQRSIKYGMCP